MLGQHINIPAVQAAEAEVVKMKELIRVRGCNEEFIADPALLQEGKVHFCPAVSAQQYLQPCFQHLPSEKWVIAL